MESNSNRHMALKLHRIHFLLDRLSDHVLQEKHDVTFSQFMTLFAIRRCDGVSQRQVADVQDVTEAAVSRHIESLEKAGFLNSSENPRNRREHALTLTELGLRVLTEASETLSASLKTVFKKLSATDKKVLDQSLDIVLATIRIEYGGTICPPAGSKHKSHTQKGDQS
jgi:DNA-binding MarR family transcriptional regulator